MDNQEKFEYSVSINDINDATKLLIKYKDIYPHAGYNALIKRALANRNLEMVRFLFYNDKVMLTMSESINLISDLLSSDYREDHNFFTDLLIDINLFGVFFTHSMFCRQLLNVLINNREVTEPDITFYMHTILNKDYISDNYLLCNVDLIYMFLNNRMVGMNEIEYDTRIRLILEEFYIIDTRDFNEIRSDLSHIIKGDKYVDSFHKSLDDIVARTRQKNIDKILNT